MIYAKSLLAGLAALIVMTVLIIGAAPLVIGMMHPATGGVGWVPIPMLPTMTGALLVSAAVSYAVFKRAGRR